jgi:CheY-like chemotaxis protein
MAASPQPINAEDDRGAEDRAAAAANAVTHILVAEDDPLVSSFLEKGLRAEGFVVDVVGDGVTAERACQTQDVDLLILDMALPGREGYEVLRRLRGLGSQVPVLVLTGRPDLRDVVACLEVGTDDYIIKPFRFEELLARIWARLRERGGGEARSEGRQWHRAGSGTRRDGSSAAAPVAHPAPGLDHLPAELAAEPGDEHVDDVGSGIEIVAPRVREQLLTAEDLVRVAHERLEQRELARRQVDGAVPDGRAPGPEVEGR